MRPGKNMTLGSLVMVIVFAVSSLALYGGAKLIEPEKEAATENGDGGVPGGPTTVALVAQNLKFDKATITASAGQPVTVELDNRDAGVLHNVAFYTNRSASQSIFVGDIFAGPAVHEFQFTAPSLPGSFFFRCDVHPDTMTGTFEVQ